MKSLPLAILLYTLIVSSARGAGTTISDQHTRHIIGQKIMLDFRYFCADNKADQHCNKPVLHLTDELATVLVKGQIGGVILFTENIQTIEQVVTFIYDMQQLMKQHNLPPLFIAIDQEGGRVARFPDHIATRFVGNMAIGATYKHHGVDYARYVADGIANALKLLGINVNFAPNVDVNVNPANPVINVRSYGESPAMVAQLGLATVAAFQQQQLISAIKHFPGHGDTHVDSHSGLPRVSHTRQEINATDLLPFRTIIASHTPPAMVMSAHIQYPALDDTTLVTAKGTVTTVPATLSRKILHNLLRRELAYEGVVVTDALDMQAISQFFSQADATLHAFRAGADIALMPYMIRSNADIEDFWQWQQTLTLAAESGELDNGELVASLTRIQQLKQRFQVGQFINQPKHVRIKNAKKALPIPANKELEKQLAKDSVTTLIDNNALPLSDKRNWQVVMPDSARCDAFIRSVKKVNTAVQINCTSLATIPVKPPRLSANDILIIGDISPLHSTYEMGGMDPPEQLRRRASNQQQQQWLKPIMQEAKNNAIPVVLIALRTPYLVAEFAQYVDVALATYGYNVEVNNSKASGAVFESVAEVLLGNSKTQGSLPVTVELGLQ
ncbi:glycoside hydrolase family 3 protein [Alteromonas ponticola]|uniref:beta-N-acetylhexosaminidase n=1 Tax=Alteromonas aquimaris TaxID=2998417 RepID=A0ABT3P5I4_9ALTE|nr:glycoside hydrolase family 3 protein [Alteromonas aquimaris]MCW8108004.1 glycoside hydrolase family 3 protein [Alteromonas aquimaris]